MSMTATIMSNLGLSVLQEDNGFYLMDVRNPGKLEHVTDYKMSHLMALKPEVKDIVYENLGELSNILSREFEKHTVMEAVLSLMDGALSYDFRANIIQLYAKQLDENKELSHFVENRLLSTVLPSQFSPQLARDLLEELSIKQLLHLFYHLEDKSAILNRVLSKLVTSLQIDFTSFEIVKDRLTEGFILSNIVQSIFDKDAYLFSESGIKLNQLLAEFNLNVKKDFFNNLSEEYNILQIHLPETEILSHITPLTGPLCNLNLNIDKHFVLFYGDHWNNDYLEIEAFDHSIAVLHTNDFNEMEQFVKQFSVEIIIFDFNDLKSHPYKPSHFPDFYKICVWNNDLVNSWEAEQVLTAAIEGQIDKVVIFNQLKESFYTIIHEAVISINNRKCRVQLSGKINQLSSIAQFYKTRLIEECNTSAGISLNRKSSL